MRFRGTVLSLAMVFFGFQSWAQTGYTVIPVADGGVISGTVKWAGKHPKSLTVPVTKDTAVCDPSGSKVRDLERLEIGTNGGVKDTVVYLADISRGKAMDLPTVRASLNQKTCRYEPHIVLMPKGGDLKMSSSDPILHNLHVTGATEYNQAFINVDQVSSHTMLRPGVSEMQCNAGHTWMNGSMFVVEHPYYAVTDENGNFRLTGVPPGQYQIVAWHEGWHIAGRESKIDVFTQTPTQHLKYSEPQTWKKSVSVTPRGSTQVDFEIGEEGAAATHAGMN